MIWLVVLEDMLIICGLLLTQGDVYLLMSKCKGNFWSHKLIVFICGILGALFPFCHLSIPFCAERMHLLELSRIGFGHFFPPTFYVAFALLHWRLFTLLLYVAEDWLLCVAEDWLLCHWPSLEAQSKGLCSAHGKLPMTLICLLWKTGGWKKQKKEVGWLHGSGEGASGPSSLCKCL